MTKSYTKKLSLTNQNFKTSDGAEIAYSDNLIQDKPTLLFIHGHLASRFNFFKLASKFNNGNYRLILIDLPGFGESSKDPNADYKLSTQASRINELVKHLKIKNLNIVGHSLGGGVSIALNGMNSEINSMTLIAPLGMPLYTKELPKIIEYYVETGKIAFHIVYPYDEERRKTVFGLGLNLSPFVISLIPKFFFNEYKEMFLTGIRANNKMNADVLYDKKSMISVLKEHPNYKSFLKTSSELGIDLDNYINTSTDYVPLLNLINKSKNVKKVDPIGNSYENLIPYLEKVNNPVLVIWGDKDQIIHYKTMETMIPHIKNGTYITYRNGSHGIAITKAKKIAKEIKKKLKL
jgi:pimeloyl-ACP methyl ester carboxylesterase